MRRIAVWMHGGVGGGFFSQGQPAVQQLIFRLARQFHIDVYTQSPPDKAFVPPSFQVFYPDRRIPGSFLRWGYLGLKFFLVSIRRRYNLVYSFWGYPAGLLAVIAGKIYDIPSVIHLQGGDAVSIPFLRYGVFENPVRAAVCRWAYSRCADLIALTHFQAACLLNNQVRAKVVVIPFGVDTEIFAFKAERFDQPLLRFLHVGNHTPVKGQEMMLQTFARVAQKIPSRLLIVGSDHFQGQLMEWCVSLGIEAQVEFLGPQPYPHLPGFYHEADIFLHTPYYEGQGVVFAEAAASGALLAGTCVGMLADMGADCAITVKPGEADLLADMIIAAVQEPSNVREMRQSARRWVEKKNVNYTESIIVQRLHDLISCCDQKKSPSLPRQVER